MEVVKDDMNKWGAGILESKLASGEFTHIDQDHNVVTHVDDFLASGD